MVEGLFVIFHVIGIVIFIPVLVLSKKAQGSSPLTEFYNPGGWASNGLATMIGSAAPLTALIGFDCSVHMCMSIHPLTLSSSYLRMYCIAEETKDSSRTVPVTLLFGYFSNVFLGLFVLLAW
jgi:amino acid transporter